MPSTPVSQHQKIAPGPPNATAVETPMIFPVPNVAASVVDKAARELLFLIDLRLKSTMVRRRNPHLSV